MPIIKKPFSLAPLNDNPAVISGTNVITGGLSHKDGFPTIKFSVPPQPAMLEIATLKLVGQVLVKKADNTVFTPAVVDGSVGQVLGTGLAAGTISHNNGANLSAEAALNIPNWGGIKEHD